MCVDLYRYNNHQSTLLSHSHKALACLPSIALDVADIALSYEYPMQRKYDHIPSVGSGGLIFSYFTALRYLIKANVVIQEGYEKYKGRIFKVPEMSQWLLIASGDELVEELRNAPESVLSMEAAMADILQSDYTLGRTIREDTYHIVYNSLIFEQELGLDLIDVKIHHDAWTPLKVVDLSTRVACRSSNRSFVGLPLCRVEDYCAVNTQFAINVMIGSAFINLFPEFLKSTVGRIFTEVSGHLRKTVKHLRPIIEERKSKIAEYGLHYPDKPNDFLSWLIDNTPPGPLDSTENLALRMLNMNFVALHTTSMSFVHALYNLAAKSEYVEPLREEIEVCLGTDPTGWTKEAFARCWKLDSFLKETQRLNGLGALSLPRKAMRAYTFRDGTTVPKGAMISATQTATHHDPAYYDSPNDFDGFRFSRVRERAEELHREGEELADQSSEDDWRYRLTGTGLNYLAFGGGKHVCPGRFFATLELKCMMAFTLLRYDVKMENEGVRPPDTWFGPACVPSLSAEVLFRLRR
ncbi:Ent-kaurene oxidase [Grifola frondosa]|uniref:Ent-kaurene oxidase n=1 Tax=Grifola frondosa TaxID=5627 RepID=A0A1C7MFP5_GRIFR|nr:Ent-kaurene oxidase [Grifola frondosa]